MKYQIFGSKSSIDYDIMVFVDRIPQTIEESKELCEEYNKKLSVIFTDKKVNCNIAVLDNENIIDVFKGTIDECNNSLYYTYDYFSNNTKQYISSLLPRNVDEKILRGVRIILSFLSRSKYRKDVKYSLRHNLIDKLETLSKIDFTNHINLGNRNITSEDFYKCIAFQLGQVYGLLNKIEVYSKESIIDTYPNLKGFLNRDKNEYDYEYLSSMIIRLIKEIKINYPHLLLLNEANFKQKGM